MLSGEPSSFSASTRASVANSAFLSQHGGHDPLHFSEMQAEINSFREQFDSWVAKKRDAIHRSKTDHMKKVVQFQESMQNIQRQLSNSESEKAQCLHKQERQEEEVKAIQEASEEALNHVQNTRKTHNEISSRFQEMSSTLARLKSEREEILRQKRQKFQRNEPELKNYENVLGLSLSAEKNGNLRFTFNRIDPKDWDRQFAFSLHISDHYEVTFCDPAIPFTEIIGRLNEDKDFYGFVKRMRSSYREYVN